MTKKTNGRQFLFLRRQILSAAVGFHLPTILHITPCCPFQLLPSYTRKESSLSSLDLKQIDCQRSLRISKELLFGVWNHDEPWASPRKSGEKKIIYRGEKVGRVTISKEPISAFHCLTSDSLLTGKKRKSFFFLLVSAYCHRAWELPSLVSQLSLTEVCLFVCLFLPPIRNYLWYVKNQLSCSQLSLTITMKNHLKNSLLILVNLYFGKFL